MLPMLFKRTVKQALVNRQHKSYQKELQRKKKIYDAWIKKEQIKGPTLKAGSLSFAFLSVTECGGRLADRLGNQEADVVIFHAAEGEITDNALPLIQQFYISHPHIPLVYGDEDVVSDIRCTPYFKPDWSPDTFVSCFYFGNFFAVRRKPAAACLEKIDCGPDGRENLYRLCTMLAQEGGGFQRRINNCFPIGHISEILFRNTHVPEFPCRPADCKIDKEQLISIIIPSKDNPQVLLPCIESVLRYPPDCRYEFIIVDNGSREENKKLIHDFIFEKEASDSLNPRIYYLYQPMPFNFSAMCNMGAEAASLESKLLLFLNDDVEAIQPAWLDKMIVLAGKPYAGAVGAKLLYPDSDIIQHAGITNLRIGPAHKLQFLSDSITYYYGKNRGVHNMIAVTGACLLVRREVFREAGGFSEKLAVAFNDVDLCYTLLEAGYYNTVCNDAVLYHHESLSRGNDEESPEKRQRLSKEKDMLYTRHRKLYGKDPFYHKYLTADTLDADYHPAVQEGITPGMPWARVTADQGRIESYREDSCLRVGIECAMDIFKWQYGITREELLQEQQNVSSSLIIQSSQTEKGSSQAGGSQEADAYQEADGFFFQGYSFVIGGDNACYEKKLLLQHTKTHQTLLIPVKKRYRQDIADNLKDQLNVDLTGFAAKVKRNDIPPGKYRIGMLAKDKSSRQRLINWSSWQLEA